ncbi:septum formation protein Maf [Fulvivirgaceae bacterium PWU4]|uniref:dTTP/UTP pyrophosphatase n=1 Tax=Chryseosolibacter histidini TaxID=2782349 RepID=A0AAP2DP97_9BACT|nr:Maf family nucleotide pyrophosphatase [Chryseosolibacter histidini]MBT1697769.1 septum formation protein Maf [Chryseosolibacter histidini]
MKLKRPLILASSSPRRQYLMKEAGFEFVIEKPDVDESFPADMPVDQVARYLASKKAEYFRLKIRDEIVVTADTVVILFNKILNKPQDRKEAIEMLSSLSGRTHLVMTGVCIVSKEKEESFDDTTEVTFQALTREEIEFYVDHYKPYDKAGAYGAQDWIGMVAIQRISGSYFNVMGLPIHKVYEHLKHW